MQKMNFIDFDEIIKKAIKSVDDKFKMLNQWNVGADTSDERYIKDIAEESIKIYIKTNEDNEND